MTSWMRPWVLIPLGAGLLAIAFFLPKDSPASAAQAEIRSRQILSEVYSVDRPYRSMMGPQGFQTLALGEEGVEELEPGELLWITGYRATMVGADGSTAMSQEFMCHSNLDLDPLEHNELFGFEKAISGRLFTLSQGQFSIELPEGFGIPVLSQEALNLTTQVLNLNRSEEVFQVRHKVDIDFVAARDLAKPLKPLFSLAAYGLASQEENSVVFGRVPADGEEHGPGCLVRNSASDTDYQDSLGQRFSGHWVVKPGREENHTLVTEILNLPFDTTVHYIAVHLHPFAESLELRDLTSGESVFRSQVRPAKKGIGIEHVDFFSSPEGLPLYRDHEYELVSIYDNTSGEDQDSMAVMYLYLLDREYR
ncbi:MAG: hypothetical protein K0U98_17855 [Deltaproteobacteria bacterium]|nr:hypothetical protein [Deltaproteobacteria bacterium]